MNDYIVNVYVLVYTDIDVRMTPENNNSTMENEIIQYSFKISQKH